MTILSQLIRKWLDIPAEPCQSCQTLQTELASARHQNKDLLDRLLDLTKPQVIEIDRPVNEIRPVVKGHRTFTAVRAELEKNDQLAARKLREVQLENKASVELLEKELGVAENG